MSNSRREEREELGGFLGGLACDATGRGRERGSGRERERGSEGVRAARKWGRPNDS